MNTSSVELLGLIIHENSGIKDNFAHSLWPEIQFKELSVTDTLLNGFSKLAETHYNICFISNRIDKGLDVFFRDMSKMHKERNCLFIQLWDKLSPSFDPSDCISIGFSNAMAIAPTAADKETLIELLKLEIHQQEIQHRMVDVHSAVQFVVRELDRVAREKSRGKDAKFDHSIRNFVVLLSQFDDDILNSYIDSLAEQSAIAPSFECTRVKIPMEILKRSLPNLTEDVYTGASLRVWDMLLKKYGVERDK